VVVHHPGRLHPGIHDHRAAEFKAALFQILQERADALERGADAEMLVDHHAAPRLVGLESRLERIEVGGQKLADMAEVERRRFDVLLELVEVLGAGRAPGEHLGRARLAEAPPLKDLLGPLSRPRDCTELDEATLERALATCAHTLYHPLGTCRMGSDEASVVDPQLRVRGVDGLRVADASVMPVIVNAPLHATVLAVAERAAGLIAGRQPGHMQPQAASRDR